MKKKTKSKSAASSHVVETRVVSRGPHELTVTYTMPEGSAVGLNLDLPTKLSVICESCEKVKSLRSSIETLLNWSKDKTGLSLDPSTVEKLCKKTLEVTK